MTLIFHKIVFGPFGFWSMTLSPVHLSHICTSTWKYRMLKETSFSWQNQQIITLVKNSETLS